MKELLDQVFTVERIMTPRAEMSTWPKDDGAQALWNNKDLARFDLVPATEQGRIAGLWIRDKQDPALLTRDRLLSRDTPVAHLLELFVETESQGFLVIYGQEIQGIVTPADFNKLPMRAYLYNLIGSLEMELARLLRARFRDNWDGLFELLSAGSQGMIESELAQTKAGNVDVDPVEFLQLSDLIDVVAKDSLLRQVLGYPSRNQVEKDLGSIVRMRHRVMHPVRPLLENVPDDLRKQQDRIRRARAFLHTLDTLGPPQTETTEQTSDVQLFENNDVAYLRWLDRLPGGYVINTERTRNPAYMVLHRASCSTIGRKNETVAPGGFTERQYIKICAEDKQSLRDWVRQHGRPDGSFSSEYCSCLRD